MLIKYSSIVACRPILIGSLIFATLLIPIVQLSFGFNYINNPSACPLQYDIMLLMALGGVFEAIFFALAFGFAYAVTPSKYKNRKTQTVAQQSAKGSNRASLILIGNLSPFSICTHFCFLLILYRLHNGNIWSMCDHVFCSYTITSI